MTSYYRNRIQALAPKHDAGQVEAFMRVQHSTLDRLSADEFASEVVIACMCINEDPDMAKRIAESFGLTAR